MRMELKVEEGEEDGEGRKRRHRLRLCPHYKAACCKLVSLGAKRGILLQDDEDDENDKNCPWCRERDTSAGK